MRSAPGPAREDAPRLLALAAAWILFFVLVDPRGGPDQAPRFWGIAAGGLGAAGAYALARRWRASPDAALLAALTLALSPLYAAAAGARADAAVAALALAALLAFLRGRARRSAAWLAAGSSLAALAGLAQPAYLLCAVGGAAALARERRLDARAAAALLGPAAAAGLALRLGLAHGPWAPGAYALRTEPSYWLRPDVLLALGSRVLRAFEIASLCLFPLAAAGALRARRVPAPIAEKAAAALIAAGSLALWVRARGLDLLPGLLHRWGLGPLALGGTFAKDAGWWGSALFWHAAAALALVSSLGFSRAAFAAARDEGAAELGAAALFCGLPYAVLLLMPASYDFQLLAVLPAAAAGAVAGMRGRVWRLAPAFAVLLGLALVSSAGLEDYFAWNRAREAAVAAALARGARPEQVDAGFDATRPPGLDYFRAVVSFAPGPARPDLSPLALVPYRSLLAPFGAAVYLYGDAALASGRPAPR